MPRPPDLISPPPASSRRGGKRPGAGARPDNLKALKHGRHSRFRDLLERPPVDPLAVADRLLVGDRQQAERIAASFLRVLLESGTAVLRAFRESTTEPTAKPIRSNPLTPNALHHEARTLIQHLTARRTPDSRHRRKKQRI
ncbi:MAG: hypothetical protein AB7R89_26055, partial [Dehalococcoidia bacterium]